ncbi:MAG: hypothetical protein N2Z69_01695 [Methylophilaceae bacterium]|nr:hypothetical protein [Methylophilaceae bacterium]
MIDICIDDRELQAVLARLQKRLSGLMPVMEDIGELVAVPRTSEEGSLRIGARCRKREHELHFFINGKCYMSRHGPKTKTAPIAGSRLNAGGDGGT